MSVKLQWFKSSYSGSEGGDCVEVATRTSTVHVRDSKAPDGPILTVAADTWSDFLTQLGSVA
ncbi:DUF397 domain-containing protein [Streptomyces sp. ME18-1-4]|uniref:DUF397 domain-containing protein n=1 Tax=Streptomyces sp. ME18-1-4 TaxID=3028685 RepID=UPI0029ACEAE2|nr:DUF397 domain-containing protein [Streptomyces sp. ME18-1-4]MDX3242274.1 DUF397 domain-containing protein [Streptomyces sp. ME18-1-4]